MRRFAFLPLFLLLFTGCEDSDFFAPEDVGLLVVDTVLVVDQPFPPLVLTRTLAPDSPFNFESAGVSVATVNVTRDGGSVDYVALGPTPGVWIAPPGSGVVRPATEYRLRVETPQGELLTAVTRTPARFRVGDWLLLDSAATTTLQRLRTFEEIGENVYVAPENQLVYNQGLLEAQFERPDAAALQVALFSLDLGSDFVIDPEFFDEEDFADLDRNNFSPMFSGNDGFVRLPWFAIFFEGRYQIKVWATDRNWDDLVRSSPSLNDGAGFGGNAGDGFEKPIFHVDGGIGLFGSASVDSIGFRILPAPE